MNKLRIIQKFLVPVGFLMYSLCEAGTGYYVTFVNETDTPLSLAFSHKDGWYPDDFENSHTIAPHGKIELYTENKAKGAGVVGVAVTSGQYVGSEIEVWQSIKGGLNPPYRASESIHWVQTNFLPSMNTGTILQHHVGTNNSDIITRIYATEQGTFNTAYATVIFPRFSAAGSCENFKVVGNMASGYCYNTGRVIHRRYVEINTDVCKATYGERFNIANDSGVLTCTPPEPKPRAEVH